MQLMLFIGNLISVSSQTGSVVDLLLIKSFRFKFSKFVPIVRLIFALLVGFNALSIQRSKLSPQKDKS